RPFAGVLGVGTHASTFGGTPLACAAGCAVVDTLQGGVLANCREQGSYLLEKLTTLKDKFPCIKAVRGKGLMIGVVLDRPAADLLSILNELGMIALSAGETVLRLLPPLTVTREECDLALKIIEQGL